MSIELGRAAGNECERMTRKPAEPLPPFQANAWSRLLVLVTLCAGLGACDAKPTNVIHQERSLYRDIYVSQSGDERCMTFRVGRRSGPQGCISLKQPAAHIVEYSKLEMAGLYVVPSPKSVLVIGLGVGVIPRTIQEMYPEARLDTVEIDPAVVRIAADYFGYRPGPRAQVVVDDGRRFVRSQLRQGKTYDLIFLDAFNGEYIPEHLLTAEFLTEVKSLLSAAGAVAANTWSHNKLFDSESITYAKVFGGFVSLNRDNRIILATKAGPPSPSKISENAELVDPQLKRYGVDKDFLLPLIDSSPEWDRSAPVLTDKYSPGNLMNQ